MTNPRRPPRRKRSAGTPKRRRSSAEEFIASLGPPVDPVEFERRRQEAIKAHREAAEPVIADLRAAGFEVATLDELGRGPGKYVDAIPILLFWLPRVSSYDVRESIVRCLSVPFAHPLAIRPLLDAFAAAPLDQESLRWAIGNAIYAVGDASIGGQIADIVADQANGRSRQMFVLALGRIGYSPAIPVLRTLLDQQEVEGHAVEALGRLRATEAGGEIAERLRHSKAWIRRAAKTALNRINGKPGR